MKISRQVFAFFTTLAVGCTEVSAQNSNGLDENCIVSILNRSARVRPDGTWRIDNVPANFGLVRVRATCVKNGITTSGQSDFINIEANIDNGFSPFQLGNATQIPSKIALTAASPTLNQPGVTDQLTVIATNPNGSTTNVTAAASGTNYTASNSAIATVNQNGLVTAVASGTVIISAINEGAVGVIQLKVMLSGADSDGDGITDDVEVANGLNPNDPVDASEDADADGLTNKQELEIGTNLRLSDTDGDGIRDGEEVVAGADGFVTNPLLADTDGDGVRDLLEIQTGSNPTDRNSVNLAQALLSLEVTPPTFVLTVNTIIGEASRQLAVIGHLKDGNTIDLTQTIRGTNYTSSNLLVANFGVPDGRVFGGQNGVATVTATNSGFSGRATVTVRTFAPTPLSSIAIPGYANNVDVSGRYAYVAAGANGLQIVDAINPRVPVIVGSRDTPGNANDVRVVGALAYVADGSAGLQIINVTNPVNPVIVGSVDTPGEAQDVYVSGNFVLIADGATGLQIINASNPAAPAIVGALDTAGIAKGVAVSGNYAVVADGSPSSAVRIIGISNPASPALVGSVAIPAESKDLDVQGTVAYVAAFQGGFHAVSFSNPASPQIVGSLPGTSPQGFVSRDVVAVGRFALAAEQLFPNVVPIVDIANPAQSLFRATLDFASLGDYAGTGIAATREFVYMTGESFIVGPENGTTGNTRLFIGQYLAIEDTAGIPPQVTITSPTPGTSVIEGRSVTVRANATDDIEVAAVNLLVNGSVVGTDTAAPYELTFTVPLNAASVRVQAQAVDFGSNIGNSPELVLPVVPDLPPTVAITSPTAGTVVAEDQVVAVHINATDDVAVASVVLLVNGVAAGTDSVAPYDFTYSVPEGVTSIAFAARATDSVGHVVDSAAVQVAATAVNDPPVITLPRGGGTGGTVRVGYYDMTSGQGVAAQVAPINTAGQTPVLISLLTAAELTTIDVLMVQNPENASYGGEYVAHLAEIQAAVSNGMVLVIHDRYVDPAETILPGGTAFNIVRATSSPEGASIDVVKTDSVLVNGPGGIIGNTTLDGGGLSNHGYAIQASLPANAELLLSTNVASHIVSLSYTFGKGRVFYSTIPLDFYLAGSNPAAFRTIYAPNAVAYAAQLFGKGYSTPLNTPLLLQGISTADPDLSQTPGAEAIVTLGVSHGVLTVANTSGLGSIAGNATAAVILRGGIPGLNLALGSLTYSPTTGFVGADALTISMNDQGNTGVGGPLSDSKTAAIQVGAAAPPPPIDTPLPPPPWPGIDSTVDLIDSDGDGILDALEIATGTNPFDATSALRIHGIRASGADIVFEFATVTGRTYGVECCTDLVSGVWTVLQDNIAGDGDSVVITDRGASTRRPQCYYRLRVR